MYIIYHIIVLIKNEPMSTLCQLSISMLTLCQGRYCPSRHYVKEAGPCRRYVKGDPMTEVDVMEELVHKVHNSTSRPYTIGHFLIPCRNQANTCALN